MEQKGKIAELLAAYGWGTRAKALLYEIIEKEPKATRERVFSRLGRKDGPIDPGGASPQGEQVGKRGPDRKETAPRVSGIVRKGASDPRNRGDRRSHE